MHPAARASSFLVVTTIAMVTANAAPWATSDVAGDASAFQLTSNANLDNTLAIASELLTMVQDWIVAGYAKRPAVMIGLIGAMVLPLLVLLGVVLYRRQATHQIPVACGPRNLHAARIEIEGAGPIEIPVSRHLLQIGRHEDNDICISDETVSRYHAVIERSDDSGITITDVSSPDGSGLRINGERMLRAVLADGDTVELGKARLKVAAAL